jgi:Leucine-rich repeat (LRR) protein
MARNSLALSHNYLQTFPARFSECTSLRYLNVRQNRIKEFPMAVSISRVRRRSSTGAN